MKFLLFVFAVCFFTLNTSAQQLEWEKIDVPIHSPVWDICFTPSGEIYAGSIGIYRSEDGGQNWEADGGFVFNDTFFEFGDVPISSDNIFLSSRGYLFATYSHELSIKKSPGATEWEISDPEGRIKFENISESSSGRLYTDYNDNLKYSDDNGDTWKSLTIEPWLSTFMVTSDDKVVILTNDEEILTYEESADTLMFIDTVTYELPGSTEKSLSEIHEINGVWVGIYYGHFDIIYLSSDKGNTWSKSEQQPEMNDIVSILPGLNNSFQFYTEDEGVFHSDATLQNWSNYTSPGLDYILNARYINGKYYACTSSGVFQSSDGGEIWEKFILGVAQVPNDVYVKDGTTYISTMSGIFFKSPNEENWEETNTEKPYYAFMDFSKFEYSHGKLYTTRDGNIMTYDPTSNIWVDVFETDFDYIESFFKNEQGDIIVSVAGADNPLIMITETGFEVIDLDLNDYSIEIFYSNGLYIIYESYDEEYYYTLDEFETINSFNYTGFEEHHSEINSIIYKNGNIYTADQAGFVRFSSNFGETWSNKSTGITEFFFRNIWK